MSNTRKQLLRELEVENRRSTAEGVFFFQAVAERSGMNLTDLQCMTILTSTGPITAGRLAEMMGLTTGAITGVVNRMEQAGYVRREKDPGDARRVVIQPVKEELERAGAGFFGSQERVMEELHSGHKDQELAVFLEIMRKANDMTREQTARIRATSDASEGGEFSAPLDTVERGRLVFANGISQITLRSASRMDDLYQARFEGPAPQVKVDDGTVTFRHSGRLKGLFDWRSRSGEITLNEAVPWEIEVRGGAYQVEADFGRLELTSFTLKGGMSDCNVGLSAPSGVVPVQFSGGANKVNVRRPAGVDVELSVKGGIGKLTFDKQRFDAVGGKVRLHNPGYEGTSNRYEIEISGGAYEISIQ